MDSIKFTVQAFLIGAFTCACAYGLYLLFGVGLIQVVVYTFLGLLIAFMIGAPVTILGMLVMMIFMGVKECWFTPSPTVQLPEQLELPFDR